MRRFLLLGTLLLALPGCNRGVGIDLPIQIHPQNQPVSVDPATAATITGIVSFEGTAPPPQKIDLSYDPACTLSKEPVFSEAYSVNGGHLQNVYVYVKEGLEGKSFAAPKQSVVLDQVGCRYRPHVLAGMVGQQLEIRNSDVAMHNIHAPQFNESQPPKGPPIFKTFTEPAVMVPIVCNQHPWMKMFLNVSPHPFFAVTDKDGKFSIQGLPPGTYTLAAVHERMGEKLMKLTVAPKSANAANFAFAQSDVK